ncbi:MAG: polysaccharide biosynthesis/export family protein [Cytophagales bacterium]|nr:polysaccharide biosynthesis/export family protein [Cytophagales bacterium]
MNQDYEFVIAPFDILALQITGMTNEEGQNIVAPFNTPVIATGAGGAGSYASGIVVDKNGEITLLYAGKIKLAGLTLPQASDTVRAALSKYIIDSGNNVTVNLKILNYSVTVLGEVGSQGILRAENEFMTVSEVLARSGGITEFGNRQTVRIIRTDRLTKLTTTYRLDLTKQTSVSPILSRLQPGDIVLVDPMRRKQYNSAGQVIGVISTFVSVPLLLFSIYQLINQ